MNYYDLLADDLGDNKHTKAGNNTYLHRVGPDLITVTLHGATILTFSSAGTIGATDAGWPTLTTVKRLNAFTPERFLFTRKGGTTYVIDQMEPDVRRIPLAMVECLDPDKGVVINLRGAE